MYESDSPFIEEASRSRLRGSLARHLTNNALREVVKETSPSYVDTLRVPGLEGAASGSEAILGGSAVFLENAQLSGLWHYSTDYLKAFSEAVAHQGGGKFGKGTYLGVGDLKGETIDLLKARETIRHDVVFTGNVVVVERADVLTVADELKRQQGIAASRIKTKIQTAPLTKLFAGFEHDGRVVDAVLVFMDAEHTAAELAVLPCATEQIAIHAITSEK